MWRAGLPPGASAAAHEPSDPRGRPSGCRRSFRRQADRETAHRLAWRGGARGPWIDPTWNEAGRLPRDHEAQRGPHGASHARQVRDDIGIGDAEPVRQSRIVLVFGTSGALNADLAWIVRAADRRKR